MDNPSEIFHYHSWERKAPEVRVKLEKNSKGPAPLAERTCEVCGKQFGIKRWRSKSGQGRFCSISWRTIGQKSRSALERFWPKVDKSGDCWLWMATKLPRGYGKF